MAQITGAISARSAKVEYSTNYSTYTDLSGGATSISVNGGDRISGEAYTFDGETPVITVGKMTPAEITVKSLYVSVSTGHFAIMSDMKAKATPLNVRWAYDTATTGSWRFTTATGFLTSAPPPAADAASGDPLAFEWTIKVGTIAEAVVA